MKEYYKRINLELRDLDIDKIKGPFYESFGAFFHQYEILDKTYLDNLIKNKIKFLIEPDSIFYTEIESIGVPHPHVDTCMTVLNYYINTQDCTTIFYDTISDSDRIMIPSDKLSSTDDSGVYIYQPKSLKQVGSFQALSNQAYLLNTHQIHSLARTTTQELRQILRFVWLDKPYRIVEKTLKELA